MTTSVVKKPVCDFDQDSLLAQLDELAIDDINTTDETIFSKM